MHIFLSYGHDDFAPLARRIRDDLSRYHEVWFDESRFKAGHAWEAKIEDALHSVAQDGGKFVLLMSPHSVSRPDGFCRKELAYACDLKIPVVPVMISDVRPPVSICDLQWVDMRKCFPESTVANALYGNALQQLFDGIEHGVPERVVPGLRLALSYEAEVSAGLPRFTGRKWVLDEVRKWLANPKKRIFWITAEAGVGKSALAAWLGEQLPETAAFHYFVWHDNNRRDPETALESVAYQLTTCIPGYESCLGPIKSGSSTSALFRDLLVDPLLKVAQPKTPVVIVLDALDEATQDGRNDLAEAIGASFGRTPPWLRFIITSRPHDSAINGPLQALDPWILEADRKENIDDLRAYLLRELKSFAPSARSLKDAVEEIINKSEGLFLYAHWVREELDQGRLSLERLDEFPQGLAGTYWQFFRRVFPDSEKYASQHVPVLQAICAAREPLETSYLQALFGWNTSQRRNRLERLGSLFPAINDRVRAFHKSVFDWLTDESRPHQYCIHIQEGHRCLADFGWKQYQQGVDKMGRYSVVHLPAHLAACGRADDLGKLLLDFDWIQTKLDLTDIVSLIADYRYLSSPTSVEGAEGAPAGRPIGIPPWRAV